MKQSQAEVHKRHQRLLELFNAHGSLQVSEVSKELNMSELTIRRDFDLLEKKGYIVRFHGGAKLASSGTEMTPVFENKGSMNQTQKQQIAAVISKYIQEKDTVFLNAGTTTLEVIKCIKNRDITIITNNALACLALEDGSATLISTGGEYNGRNKSYTGALATNLMNRVFATVCILGVNGITHTDGITTSAYLETMINEEMLKRCKGKKIVAADGSKVGRTFCFTSAEITDIDILVTDSSADPKELERMREKGVEIVLADKV
ncbi:DeoR family transcriptional regulator [Clostridium sp. MCC353]|uniref:DeoR/GlpR family DNA-binding transcription regulator n=1 Tax=Clostridium sp. MCC353 TaxID=2592646 RepID=UPI001C02833B|nr:DeoR/GlpR family DNA-binding transcription regulator [Clostridium sp. MCC353]MBT9775301.1 DeoR family transcriptional regulator [Clostridium sp. MCC353]